VTELPEHVARNRAQWDEWATDYAEEGRRQWAADAPTWGIWHVPEAQLRMLPDDARGLDAVELGCGAGYVSAWLTRRGARCVAIDNSEAQLATARELQREHGLDFELIHGNAEAVPKPDASFDFAISEYGASLWCEPERWIGEAARLLRPAGRLVFMTNAVLLMLCAPDDENEPAADRLLRPQFGMRRFEWPGEDAVEFHLPHGELIAVLRGAGFEIEELIEVQIPEGATTKYPFVDAGWAQRWPSEEVWKVRRR
jgi:SAM-dependent methyltransferase